MAVTWIDTPGVPISKRETIDFSVPAMPVAISVGYYTTVRVHERILLDGAFLYPFLGSTVEGSGPYTFHLVRSGGWPDDAQVYVDESGGGGSSVVAPTWQKIYELDFTAVAPPSTLYFPTASGTYVMDGKTWYRKQSLGYPVADYQPFLDPLYGLGWAMSFGGGGSAIGDLDNIPSTILTPHWWLPFSSIPEYDPAIPVCVRIRPPGFTSNVSDQGGWAVGITSCTDNTTSHDSTNRQYDAFVVKPGGTGRTTMAGAYGNSGITSAQASMNCKNGMAVYSFPGLASAHLVAGTDAASWTGYPAHPGLMAQVGDGRIGYSASKITMPRPNPGIMFMPYGNGIPGSSVAVPHFEIWQYYSVAP